MAVIDAKASTSGVAAGACEQVEQVCVAAGLRRDGGCGRKAAAGIDAGAARIIDDLVLDPIARPIGPAGRALHSVAAEGG